MHRNVCCMYYDVCMRKNLFDRIVDTDTVYLCASVYVRFDGILIIDNGTE